MAIIAVEVGTVLNTSVPARIGVTEDTPNMEKDLVEKDNKTVSIQINS